MKLGVLLGLLLSVLLWTGEAAAHHGASGGAGSVSQTISERLNPPRSNLYFNVAVNSLDEDLGVFLLYQIQGEYAINSRFSLGARIPFYSVRENLLPASDEIGDVALLLKGQVWNDAADRMSLNLGMDVGFPTGNSSVSLGAGAVSFNPYLVFSKDFGVLQVYTALNSSFEAASDVNPTPGYEVGIILPVLEGPKSVNWLFAFQGTTYLANDTFTAGSTKAFAVSGILVRLSEHWEAAALGKISVVDTLNLKSNISFTDFATGLLNDVKGGFNFNLGYIF